MVSRDLDANGAIPCPAMFKKLQLLVGKPDAIAIHPELMIALDQTPLTAPAKGFSNSFGGIPVHANILIPKDEIRFMRGSDLIGTIKNIHIPANNP